MSYFSNSDAFPSSSMDNRHSYFLSARKQQKFVKRPHDYLDESFDPNPETYLRRKFFNKLPQPTESLDYLPVDKYSRNTKRKYVEVSLTESVKQMVDKIQNSPDLVQEEELRYMLINVIVSEIATRYGLPEKTLYCPDFDEVKNQTLVNCIFQMLARLVAKITDSAIKYYLTSSEKGIFTKQANLDRACNFFRNELAKRIDTKILLRDAVALIKDGSIFKVSQLTEGDKLKLQLEDVRTRLDLYHGPKYDFNDLKTKVNLYSQEKALTKQKEKIKTQKFRFESNKVARIFSADPEDLIMEDTKVLSPRSRIESASTLRSKLLSDRNMDHIEKDISVLMEGLHGSSDDENDLSSDNDHDPLLYKAHIRPYSKYAALKNIEESDRLFLRTSEHQDLQLLVDKEDPKNESELETALKKAIEERPVSRRERFLTPTGDRKEKEVKFDFEKIELRPKSKKKTNNFEPNITEKRALNHDVVRVVSCKFANRQHQGAITLIPDKVFNISEFQSGNSLAEIEKLDQVRLASRELAEMYDTFIQMVPQAVDNLHEEVDENHLNITAPEETSISERFSSVFNGKKEFETPKRKPKQWQSAGKSKNKNGSYNTLDDRGSSGRKQNSSKFNFGGYVPINHRKKDDQHSEDIRSLQFNFFDYLNYLQDYNHDYLDSLVLDKYLIDLEEEEKMRLKAMQEQQMYEEEMRKREELIRKERERRAAMLEYKEGNWNAGVMEFLSEFSKPDETLDLQIKMENIWTKLKMPLQMKIEMAVKFGNHRLSQESFRGILDLWLKVAELVRKRESLLVQLEKFESKASEPNRYFAGSSKAMNRETRKRNNMMAQLKKYEEDISLLLDQLKHKDPTDEVTYEGQSYRTKMRSDYFDMLYRLQQQRHDHKRE